MNAARCYPLILGLLMLGAAQTAQAEEQALTPLPDRPAAPALTLKDTDGGTHALSQYLGQVVIVNFWATWCPPCREEMPSMQRAWKAVKDEGIALLAVNVGETEDQVWAFTADYPVEFPLLLDTDGATIGHWPVRGLPTTFVVDPDGRVAYRAIGGRAWDAPELLGQIRTLQTRHEGAAGPSTVAN